MDNRVPIRDRSWRLKIPALSSANVWMPKKLSASSPVISLTLTAIPYVRDLQSDYVASPNGKMATVALPTKTVVGPSLHRKKHDHSAFVCSSYSKILHGRLVRRRCSLPVSKLSMHQERHPRRSFMPSVNQRSATGRGFNPENSRAVLMYCRRYVPVNIVFSRNEGTT